MIRDLLLQHRSILKKLIQEAEGSLGIQPAFPYSMALANALRACEREIERQTAGAA